MKKYKFILTLPDGIQVDSAEESHGHMAWPNYAQADPVVYKGIFDSYEEAEAYAADYHPYKYVLLKEGYDSYDSEDEPIVYLSIFDAEDAVCAYLDIVPGDPYCQHPDSYKVETATHEGEQVYTYRLYHRGECVYDSLEDNVHFDSLEDAEEEAQYQQAYFDVVLGGLDEYYSLEPIETVHIEIVEANDPEEDA